MHSLLPSCSPCTDLSSISIHRTLSPLGPTLLLPPLHCQYLLPSIFIHTSPLLLWIFLFFYLFSCAAACSSPYKAVQAACRVSDWGGLHQMCVCCFFVVGRWLLLQSNLSAAHRAGRKRRDVLLTQQHDKRCICGRTNEIWCTCDNVWDVNWSNTTLTDTQTNYCTHSALVCTVTAFQWPTYYIPLISWSNHIQARTRPVQMSS